MNNGEKNNLLIELSLKYMLHPKTTPESSGALGQVIMAFVDEDDHKEFMEELGGRVLEMMTNDFDKAMKETFNATA